MLRSVLLLILSLLVVRAVTRVLIGVAAGSAGGSRRPHPGRGEGGAASSVHMTRDPVCGTYVIPDRAIPLTDGSDRLFFCSAECRDRYRSRPAEGRTA
jgi:hypothetical protein